MSELTLSGTDADMESVATLAAPVRPLAAATIRRPATDLTFGARLGVVAGLTVLAYFFVFAHVVADAIAGSRAAFLVVVPVLVMLIAVGYRIPPRGVGDTESDWILTTLAGTVAFTGIHLLSERMPTLAGLWRVQLLGIIVWFACSLAVMFGVRHVVHMWKLWLFSAYCATPLPFLMTTAALGGSDTAAALLAAALGAIAVSLAGRREPAGRRFVSAASCLGVAATVVVAVGDHLNLMVTTVMAAGLVPVLTVAVLQRTSSLKTTVTNDTHVQFPRTSRVSLIVLAVIALGLFTLNPPAGGASAVASVADDWAERAGLHTPTPFPFITRFLGEGTTLVRYGVTPRAGLPAAAVDVMSVPRRAVLDDLADAVWYPTTRPVDYRSADRSPVVPLGARVVHTNADATTDSAGQDWYAITWLWRTPDAFQRVTVVISQAIGADQPPPEPAPLSLLDTSLRPAMWLARQQPDVSGQVDELVTRRAADVVRVLAPSAAGIGASSGA